MTSGGASQGLQWSLLDSSGLTLVDAISNFGNKLLFENQNSSNYDIIGHPALIGARARY
jgi:hypothetical protein